MSTTDPAFDLAQQMGFQSAEYDAWKTFVAEWRAAGLPDMDDASMTPVIKAVEVWAEMLVALRCANQDAQGRAIAMLDKITAYKLVATIEDETK